MNAKLERRRARSRLAAVQRVADSRLRETTVRARLLGITVVPISGTRYYADGSTERFGDTSTAYTPTADEKRRLRSTSSRV